MPHPELSQRGQHSCHHIVIARSPQRVLGNVVVNKSALIVWKNFKYLKPDGRLFEILVSPVRW